MLTAGVIIYSIFVCNPWTGCSPWSGSGITTSHQECEQALKGLNYYKSDTTFRCFGRRIDPWFPTR
jgi:hypothetical protein